LLKETILDAKKHVAKNSVNEKEIKNTNPAIKTEKKINKVLPKKKNIK